MEGRSPLSVRVEQQFRELVEWRETLAAALPAEPVVPAGSLPKEAMPKGNKVSRRSLYVLSSRGGWQIGLLGRVRY